MLKAKHCLILTLPLALASLFSCGGQDAQTDVVVSFYPLEYLATRIAGEKLSVTTIVPRGAEPHDFELRASDVAAMYASKAIFLNGINMEPFESSVLSDSNLVSKTTVLTDSMDGLITVESSHGSYLDPHVWLDTDLYAKMGETMLGKFIAISPENEALFRTNYASLKEDLEGLKAYGQSKSIEGKTIAVSHDAFRYMCREFNFEEVHINGLSPDVEPTAKQLQEILDVINELGIDTIFFEELESQDIADYIASQTGAKVEVLSPLENIDEGEDYLSVYKENIDKISSAKSK